MFETQPNSDGYAERLTCFDESMFPPNHPGSSWATANPKNPALVDDDHDGDDECGSSSSADGHSLAKKPKVGTSLLKAATATLAAEAGSSLSLSSSLPVIKSGKTSGFMERCEKTGKITYYSGAGVDKKKEGIGGSGANSGTTPSVPPSTRKIIVFAPTPQEDQYQCTECGELVPLLRVRKIQQQQLFRHHFFKFHTDRFKCKTCRGSSSKSVATYEPMDKEELVAHLESQHEIIEWSDYLKICQQQQGRIKCPTCGKHVKGGKGMLSLHMTTHDARPFICSVCEQSYQDKCDCNGHMEKEHPGGKWDRFVCKYPGCTSSLEGELGLRKHIQEEHGDCEEARRLMCFECGKVFNIAHWVKRHVKTVHEGVLEFELRFQSVEGLGKGIVLKTETGSIESLLKKGLAYSELHSFFKTIYASDLKPYLDATPQQKFAPLNNFFEYLSKFAKCFVHLTNFQNVDIEPTEFPIVIHHHIPALQTVINEQKKRYHEVIRWIPTGLNFTGVSLETYSCPFSTLVEHDTGICLNFNPHKFFMRARPWNCELNVALYPPLYVFLWSQPHISGVGTPGLEFFLKYPRLWNRQIGDDIHRQYRSTIRTKVFNAWIIDSMYENKWTMKEFSEWKIKKDPSFALNILSHDVHFLMETRRTQSQQSWASEITNVKIPLFCFTIILFRSGPCSTVPRDYIISSQEWHAKDLEGLYNTLDFERNKEWTIIANPENSLLLEMGFVKHFLMCENYIEHKGYWVNLPFTSTKDRIAHALIHVLQSAMGNSSYLMNPIARLCTNGKWLKLTNSFEFDYVINPATRTSTLEITTKQTLIDDSILFHVQYPHFALRFVSCGLPQESGLQFMELVNIFDFCVWLCLLILLMGLSLFMQGNKSNSTNQVDWRRMTFHNFKECFTNLFPFIKALLEQGDNYLASSKGRKSLLIRGSFIAVALVLSNAYKGQNVYNLVTNRKLVPYHYFKQLIQDNFTIYSEIINPSINKAMLISGNLSGMKITRHSLFLDKYNVDYEDLTYESSLVVSLQSEIESIYNEMEEKIEEGEVYMHEQLEQIEILVKHSEMLPTTIDTIHEVREEFFPPYFNATMLVSRARDLHEEASSLVRTLFTKWQRKHALEALKRCNKVALILPSFVCHRFAQKLSEEISKERIYVGKQVLHEHSFHVRLNGPITLDALKRFKWMQVAGIWEFWVQIFRDRTLYIDKQARNELKKPTMSGNVSIIFTTWIVGVAIGTVVFFVEIIKLIYSFIRFVIDQANKLIRIIVRKLISRHNIMIMRQ
ncbi:unnamed protein product [Orchesella dallaii]|uniref:C2H2-type domain-containing protein n=1 Tax=Orchesella dallaii TaxID=48710 RepID=A0ABP1RU97_9HEXA